MPLMFVKNTYLYGTFLFFENLGTERITIHRHRPQPDLSFYNRYGYNHKNCQKNRRQKRK